MSEVYTIHGDLFHALLRWKLQSLGAAMSRKIEMGGREREM